MQESEKATASSAAAGPWQAQELAGWRLNMRATRPMELFDGQNKVNASVTYGEDGAFELTVRGQKMPAKAELKGPSNAAFTLITIFLSFV